MNTGNEPWDWNYGVNPASGEDYADTYRLALESALRWAWRGQLTPELRIRRIKQVIEAALS